MAHPAGSAPGPDHWNATRAQTSLATQIASDESDYLGVAQRDIGRLVGQSDRELFVSCAAGDALQQQFEQLQPDFVAVHDLGTRLSRQLLAGIATAGNRPVQTLTIRRQGFGTPLASLQFVELSTPDGSPMRLYSTESEADTATRHAVARMLLAYSRLGVMMVGELPSHALASSLAPWRDELLRGPWPNRELLLLPMSASSALMAQGEQLVLGSAVTVRTTPRVTRPTEAWNFINSTWSRLREQMHSPGSKKTAQRSAAPVAAIRRASARNLFAPASPVPRHDGGASTPDHPPSTLNSIAYEQAMPTPTRSAMAVPAPAAAPVSSTLQSYVQQVSEIGGVLSCCIFDPTTKLARAHAGGWPEAGDLALHGADLLAAMISGGRHLGLGHAPPESTITLETHHLLLRPLPNRNGLVLHAVLDKSRANLMLARLQIQRLDTLLED